MKGHPSAFPVTILSTFAPFFTGSASAGGVIECSNCASPNDVALQSGPGLTVVADFECAQLTAFDVEFDHAQGRWRANETPVPPQLQMAFLRIVESTLPEMTPLHQRIPRGHHDAPHP
ncbi:hypothetical protein [Stenotrophomonas maltophilia]|uniref:hypothetical protein n=1 Tax=Stenotrophomonas maltophilia TaxID=40324 RepID=UPI0039F689F5